MDTEGLNLRRISYEGSWNDSPSWSPVHATYSEIAFASRIERGPFDIVVYDFQHEVRRASSRPSRGSNERPGLVAERSTPRVHVEPHWNRSRSLR